MIRYAAEFSFPLFLKRILEWLGEEKSDMQLGYTLAIGLTVAIMVRGYIGIRSDYLTEWMYSKSENAIRVRPFW